MDKTTALNIVTGLNTQTRRAPRKVSIKVVCLECGKKWSTTNDMPQCSKCNSVDIEPREL